MNLTTQILTGFDSSHVKFSAMFFCHIHPIVEKALKEMYHSALKDNIKITILSGYRNIYKQTNIWNDRYLGYKALLDQNENKIDVTSLTSLEKVITISKWVSIPGLSRHHWGTDLDIYDSSKNFKTGLYLKPVDYTANNNFHSLYVWLTENASKFGFYQPHCEVTKTLLPEPWHWSYEPLASKCLTDFNNIDVIELLTKVDFKGKMSVFNNKHLFF